MFDFFLLLLIVSDSNLNLDGVTKVLIHAKGFVILCILNCLKLFSFGTVVSHSKCQPSAREANEGGEGSLTFFHGKDLCTGFQTQDCSKWQRGLKISFTHGT